MLETGRLANDAAESDASVSRLFELNPAPAVLETAGSRQYEAASTCQAAGLVVLNRRAAPDFGRFIDAQANNNAPNARMLAVVAHTRRRRPERTHLAKPMADAELPSLLTLLLRRP